MNVTKAYQGFIDEPVPSIIFDAIVSDKRYRLFKIVSMGLLLITGFLVAMAIEHIIQKNTEKEIPTLNLEQMALSAHATFATDAVYPVRVGVENMDHLTRWLSYRIGQKIHIQNLIDSGYQVLGANLVPDGDHVAASIVYENTQKNRISLIIRKSAHAAKSEQPRKDAHGQLNWISWHDSRAEHVIVGEIGQSELQHVYDQF